MQEDMAYKNIIQTECKYKSLFAAEFIDPKQINELKFILYRNWVYYVRFSASIFTCCANWMECLRETVQKNRIWRLRRVSGWASVCVVHRAK